MRELRAVLAAKPLRGSDLRCRYDLDFKNPASAPESKITGAALADMYRSFIADYPIVSIEDPFDQDDFDSYTSLTASVKEQIVRSQISLKFVKKPRVSASFE